MSGIDERSLWTCRICGTPYYSLKLDITLDYTGGFIIMEKEGPVFYYFPNLGFETMEEAYFEDAYARDLWCDNCHTAIDRRTSIWKNIRSLTLEAFRNRKPFREMN